MRAAVVAADHAVVGESLEDARGRLMRLVGLLGDPVGGAGFGELGGDHANALLTGRLLTQERFVVCSRGHSCISAAILI